MLHPRLTFRDADPLADLVMDLEELLEELHTDFQSWRRFVNFTPR